MFALQNGYLSYYNDTFSIVVIVLLLTLPCLSARKQLLTVRLCDLWYVLLTATCFLSWMAYSFRIRDCENAMLVICGLLTYIGMRHAGQSKRCDSICFMLVLALLCSCMYERCHAQPFIRVFSNINFLAGFVSIATPLVFGRAMSVFNKSAASVLLYSAICVMSIVSLLFLGARGALVGLLVALATLATPALFMYCYPRHSCVTWTNTTTRTALTLITGLTLACFVAGRLCKGATLSETGRVLSCTVAGNMTKTSLLRGVGFANFAYVYNLYQGSYFAAGHGSMRQHMAANHSRHAFNEPLEVAAELGIPGLVVLLLFAGLILNEVWKVVRRNGVALEAGVVVRASGGGGSKIPRPRPASPPPFGKGDVGGCSHSTFRGTGQASARLRSAPLGGIPSNTEAAPTVKPDYLTLGMAGAVVCFMVMSLFHFPRKVVPTWLVFNYALAWVVTANQQHEQGVKESKRKPNTWVILAWRMFWLLAFLGSAALVPLYVKNYLDARRWIAAQELIASGHISQAYAYYAQLYEKLAWSGRFCAYYGDATMAAAESTNQQVCIEGSPEMRALALYEKAKYTYPDPYMFENLAVAYLRVAAGTNWPVFVQTQYRMETPAQTMMRKLREWRCGTNLFFEPPPTRLTQSDCIGRAINYLTLASNILPWRLTSRWYLAQIYRDVGDVSNAVKYAQMVVNIPMKKDTPQGRVFKRKAQIMLNELGVPCDDPGMVVFDIHDRKTWNEGKW